MRIPNERDLPTSWLNARRAHLMAEITAEPPRRRPAVALVGAVAATAVIGVPTLLATNSPTANAVTENADGTITVTIRDWEDPSSVQERLEELEVPAVVAFLPSGEDCTWPGTTWTEQPAEVLEHGAENGTYVIYPDRIAAGYTAAITFQYAASDDGEVAALARTRIADGSVGECSPVADDSVVDPDGMVGG